MWTIPGWNYSLRTVIIQHHLLRRNWRSIHLFSPCFQSTSHVISHLICLLMKYLTICFKLFYLSLRWVLSFNLFKLLYLWSAFTVSYFCLLVENNIAVGANYLLLLFRLLLFNFWREIIIWSRVSDYPCVVFSWLLCTTLSTFILTLQVSVFFWLNIWFLNDLLLRLLFLLLLFLLLDGILFLRY